jgi:hypothetical protein
MPDTRQFAAAELATSAAVTRYAMRSALDATQFAQRHGQVIGAVARRQLTPVQVERALAASADWSAVAHEVATALATFAETLAQHSPIPHEHAASSSDEPVSRSAALGNPPRPDVSELTALLGNLAQPGVTAGARRRALTRLNTASINHTLGGAATAWFALLDALSTATLRAINPALLGVLRAAQPADYDGQVIELCGPIATDATTYLEIENTLARSASLRCTCLDVRRADGIGPSFAPAVTVTPPQQQLDAHSEGSVLLSVRLDESHFAAHATYVGALSVESDGGTTLRIPLRITTVPAHP